MAISSRASCGEEDRLVVADQARRARRVPRQLSPHDGRDLRDQRSIPARPAARRRSGTPVEAAPGLRILRHRGALQRRRGDRRDRRARPRDRRCASCPTGARLARRAADRAVPELPGGVGLRSGARRAELRFLRLAEAGRLRRDQGAHPPRQRAAVFKVRGRRPRADPPLVRGPVVRPVRAERVVRSSTASMASTSPTGRSTRTPSAPGRPRPATTTTRPRALSRRDGRTKTRQVRHVRWDPGGRPGRALLRRRAGPGHAGLSPALLKPDRAVPDRRPRPLRHGLPLGLRRRALPGRAGRGRPRLARRCDAS
jgi:hypothetical protein